jgi:hypothetical protein
MVTRRDWIRIALGGAAAALVPSSVVEAAGTAGPEMVVYKTPTCGCCSAWVDHAKRAGFRTSIRDLPDLSEVKATFGVPAALQSCHTATVGGYVVEGHVPLDLVSRLLAERPKMAGIAVPGMPAGSPGMEVGNRKDPYDVVLFDRAGKTRLFARR